MLQEFRLRIQLYSAWDRQLASRTRFFGAAAAINAALTDLCTPGTARLFLSRATMDFLSMTGRHLESRNVALAARIANNEIQAEDLDDLMVITEQHIVERALQVVRVTDASRFSTLVTQLNVLLQATGRFFGGYDPCNRYSYASSLRALCTELHRPLDFARLDDRVRIGHQLISHLRLQRSAPRRLLPDLGTRRPTEILTRSVHLPRASNEAPKAAHSIV